MGERLRFVTVTLVLVLVCGCAFADFSGSTMHIVEPIYGIEADSTYTFVFLVTRDMSSTEILTEARVFFYPVNITPYAHTIGFDEIEPGRPSFEFINQSSVVVWREIDDTAGIRAGESTLLRVDAHMGADTPPWSKGLIGWGVKGASGSSNAGYFYIYTPVSPGTWGAIKALYR